jgi:hypothetical protein
MRMLYPYPTLVGDVDLYVRSATIDGQAVPSDFLEPDRRLLAIAGIGRDSWDIARVKIEVTAPQTEIKDFISKDAKPTALSILHGGATNMRRGVQLQSDPANPARWTGVVELDRPHWYGRLELTARVVATVDGVRGRVIGEAHPWAVALDDLPRPPVHGNIPVRWDNFKEPESLPELTTVADQPFFVHLDVDQPVLYLNDGFSGLRPLLEDRARRPRDAQVLHDQTRVTFASAAWTAMFESALAAAAEVTEPGEPEFPSEEWERNVLEILLARMYQERTPEDALDEVVRLLRQGDGFGTVQSRLAAAVSEQVGGPRLLRGSINRLSDLEDQREDANG